MNSPVPSFLESITRDRAAVLTQAWDDCEGIPPKAGLMRIARQTSLDFRIVRYWFYCRSNYEGIARAFDALGPRQKLEFPKLEEYYLFDRFTDDLDAAGTSDPTPQALGPSHDASPTSSQQSQPAHAQAESISSTSTRGRVRRATMKKQQLDALDHPPNVSSTSSQQSQPAHAQAESSSSASTQRRERRASSATKKPQQKPPTATKNKQQHRSLTQEPTEDREVKVESKARTKRPKISTVSAAPPPPTGATAEAESILSMTAVTPSEMDSVSSLSAATLQATVALTSPPTARAVDVNMADVTAISNCDSSSAATPLTHASVNSKVHQSKMFMSAVIIPPYKASSSGSSSPTSSRRSHITILRQSPSVLHSATLDSAIPDSALGAETINALTLASTPKVRLKLIRNRMEPQTQECRGSNSENSINPPTCNSGADLAIEQELGLQGEKITATNTLVQEARAKAKVVAVSKRQAESTLAASDGEPSTTSIETPRKKRSKSAPLSLSRGDEPDSQTMPKLKGSRERVLSHSEQVDESIFESGSHLSAADTAPAPVEKETLGARAGEGMVGDAEDKEVKATEDQEEGHLGTVHPNPIISSMANSSLQPRTRTVIKTSEGGDVVQGDKQNERFPEQQRSARLSRSRSRGPSTAPTRAASQAPSRPRVPAPDNGDRTEPTQILTAQHDVANDALEGVANGPAVASNGQKDSSTSAQRLWDQPWTKQYASIKPMKRRNTIMESGFAPSSSKSSQSVSLTTNSITSSSSSANNAMAPDERMASEKKIVSMDQTPPTPKSTDDTEREAKTTQSKELQQHKNNDSQKCEHEESLMAESNPMFPNEHPYMGVQIDEMDGGGSSYSPDATYDCLSPTNPYHSDGPWSEGQDVENNALASSATHGRHWTNVSTPDNRGISDRSRRGDYSNRSRRSREHGDHSRERGHRRRSHWSSDRIRGRSRDRSEGHSSRAHGSRDRSRIRSVGRPGKALRSRDRSRERSKEYLSRPHHSNDRSRDRFEGRSVGSYHSNGRSKDRFEGHSVGPYYPTDGRRDRFRDSTNKTHRFRARSQEHSEDRSRGHSGRSHRYD